MRIFSKDATPSKGMPLKKKELIIQRSQDLERMLILPLLKIRFTSLTDTYKKVCSFCVEHYFKEKVGK